MKKLFTILLLSFIGISALYAETVNIKYVNKDKWSKVTAHMWDGSQAGTSWPGEEMTKTSVKKLGFDVYEISFNDGDYKKIIFSNNGSSQTGNLDINKDKPVYYNGSWYASLDDIRHDVDVRGTFNGWGSDDKLLDTTDDDTYSGVVNLPEGEKTYEFKVTKDGSWYGKNSTTITSSTSVTLSSSDGNCKITTTMAGDYTFAYTISTHNLTVTYPEPPADPATITVTSADDSQGIVSPAEVQVNETQSATITATPKAGYMIDTWTLGGSAVLAEGNLTDASIKVKSDGTTNPGTAVASFKVDPDAIMLYFVNKDNWDVVNIYMWDGSVSMSWPGVAMTKTGDKKLGYDIYSYSVHKGDCNSYKFNCGGDACQSNNFGFDENKRYVYDNQQYASLDDIVAHTVIIDGSSYGYDKFQLNNTTDDDTYTGSINITGSQYQFKIKADSETRSDETTYTDSFVDKKMSQDKGRTTLTTPVAGEYQFKYVVSTKLLSVTYPAPPVDPATITVTSADDSQGTVSPAEVQVNETQSAIITATPKAGYMFDTWTLSGSAILAEGNLTDASIKVKGDGTTDPGTAVASFKVDPDAKVVKYLNINNWDVVYIHMWGGTKEGTQWHGLPMAKTGEQKYGYDVYSISIKEGDYKNCIFNNNDTQQSADLVFGKDDAQYEPDYTKLVYGLGKWYATLEEIPEPEYITLVYVNKAGWSNVNIQMKGGSPEMNWPGVAMTKSDDKKFGIDVYTYTFMKGQYTNYIINKGDGGGQIEKNIEEGKYVHYSGVRYATLDAIPLPSLAGDFNGWSADANIFELSDESVGSTTVTLSANETYEFKVVDGSMLGNNGTITETISGWTMKVEDDNCKITTKNKGEFTFTYDVKTSKLSVTYPEFSDKIDLIVTNAEGENIIEMTKNPSAEKEYYKYDLFLRTGDVVTFYDHYSLKAFKPKSIDSGASMSDVATITDNGLEITQSINTNFYLILEAGNDKVQLQHGYKVLDEIAPNAFLSEIKDQTVDLHIYRSLDTQSYSTLCLPFALDASQLEYYFPNAQIAKLTSAEVEKRGVKYITTLNFTKVSAIEAGMPYIILPSEDITEIQKFEDVTVTVTDGQTQGGEIVDAVGILKPTTLYKDAYNYLFLGADNKLFYPNVTGNLKGMRSYFYVKDDAPANLLMGATPKQLKAFPALMTIGEPETEEGLTTEAGGESEDAENKPYKIYNENNEVIIIFEEGKRNLAGQQVD